MLMTSFIISLQLHGLLLWFNADDNLGLSVPSNGTTVLNYGTSVLSYGTSVPSNGTLKKFFKRDNKEMLDKEPHPSHSVCPSYQRISNPLEYYLETQA
jgi:hypothetical protein